MLVPTKSLAQQPSIPDVDTTLEYLSSELGMRLLLSQFSLAFELANLALVQLETSGLGDDEGLQRIYGGNENAGEVFNVLFQMASADGESLRNQATQAMVEGSDPLNEDNERHSALLANFADIAAEIGVDTGAEPIRSAMESLTHVERITRTVLGGLGLCNIFPFSTKRFCESP
jgi:hypothetical protein